MRVSSNALDVAKEDLLAYTTGLIKHLMDIVGERSSIDVEDLMDAVGRMEGRVKMGREATLINLQRQISEISALSAKKKKKRRAGPKRSSVEPDPPKKRREEKKKKAETVVPKVKKSSSVSKAKAAAPPAPKKSSKKKQ